MQPIHATSDMNMADKYWGKRSEFAYAWRTQLMQGAILAFGSDAPVESPNPFLGLHAAITRRRADGSPGKDGWYSKQRLTPMEAIKAFTSGPAYACGMENQLGKLSPGYLADLILLDIDPFACEPDALLESHPHATMVAGEWVFQY
jgi:predicted amidohydrolase YtcJ